MRAAGTPGERPEAHRCDVHLLQAGRRVNRGNFHVFSVLRGLLALFFHSSVSGVAIGLSCGELGGCYPVSQTAADAVTHCGQNSSSATLDDVSGKVLLCQSGSSFPAAALCECDCRRFLEDKGVAHTNGRSRGPAEERKNEWEKLVAGVCGNLTQTDTSSRGFKQDRVEDSAESIVQHNNVTMPPELDKSRCRTRQACATAEPFGTQASPAAEEEVTAGASSNNTSASTASIHRGKARKLIHDPSPVSGAMAALIALIGVIICVGISMVFYRK